MQPLRSVQYAKDALLSSAPLSSHQVVSILFLKAMKGASMRKVVPPLKRAAIVIPSPALVTSAYLRFVSLLDQNVRFLSKCM